MNDRLIIYKADKIMSARKFLAEKRSRDILNKAMQNQDFATLYREQSALIPIIARKKTRGENYAEDEKTLLSLNKNLENELAKMDLRQSDIVPNYYCKKCGDTGQILGKTCECYVKLVNSLREDEMGKMAENDTYLSEITSDILPENEKATYEALVAKFGKLVSKFPNTTIRFLLFTGEAGCGKTYLAKALSKELEKRGYDSLTLSAFSLNDNFLKYHTTFDESNSGIMTRLSEVSTLVIDDLGTEPMFNNVTKEYLTNLVNERNRFGKLTIITTNLSPDGIKSRYTERLSSRLFDKLYSKTIPFKFSDLRRLNNEN